MTRFDRHLDEFRDTWLKQGHEPQRDEKGAFDWYAWEWEGGDGGCHEQHGPVCVRCGLSLSCLNTPPNRIPRCTAAGEEDMAA